MVSGHAKGDTPYQPHLNGTAVPKPPVTKDMLLAPPLHAIVGGSVALMARQHEAASCASLLLARKRARAPAPSPRRNAAR